MHELGLNDIPIIDRGWVLRNDSDYLLLYKFSSVEVTHYVLPPILGIIVSLIDGTSTFAEIGKRVQYIFSSESLQSSYRILSQAIATLNANATIVTKKDTNNSANIFETCDYFIPPQNYKFPKHSRLRLPTNVMLITTNRCHTNCIYCYADLSSRKERYLVSIGEWENLIDYCIDRKIFNLDITGGDPIADPDSVRLLLKLIKLKQPVFISTKARLTKEIVSNLIRAGFHETPRGAGNTLQISVDSVRPAVADKLTRCKDYLMRADANVRLCIEYGIKPKIKAVLTPLNYQEIVDIIEKYSLLGVSNFQFVYYGLSFFRPREDLLLKIEEKQRVQEIYHDEVLPRFGDLQIILPDDTSDSTSTRMTKSAWDHRSRCSGGYSAMVVLPTGKVTLCEQMPQRQEYIVGDIRQQSLEDIWMSDYLENWLFPPIEKFAGTSCFGCHQFEECHYNAGFCYRDALFAYDTMFEAAPKCPYQTRDGRRQQ